MVRERRHVPVRGILGNRAREIAETGIIPRAAPWPVAGQGPARFVPSGDASRMDSGWAGPVGSRGHGPEDAPRAARGQPVHAVRARVRLTGLADGWSAPAAPWQSPSFESPWTSTDRRGRQARESCFGFALGRRVLRGRPVTRGDGRRRQLPGAAGPAVHPPGWDCSGIDSGRMARARGPGVEAPFAPKGMGVKDRENVRVTVGQHPGPGRRISARRRETAFTLNAASERR